MSPIREKSFSFAVKIVKFVRWLKEKTNNYELASQLLRSGTSIGANVAEAQSAQSKKDFISKMYIAFKEVNEAVYWLQLLREAGIIREDIADELLKDATEIKKILASIIKSAKENIEKKT